MAKNDYFIGEALIGSGNELAHIDLLIGSKDGPIPRYNDECGSKARITSA